MKGRWKKATCAILGCIFLAGISTLEADAAITHSGKSGDLEWTIDSDGHFVLSGSGNYELNDYLLKEYTIEGYEERWVYDVPEWYQYRYEIWSAEINVEDCTSFEKLLYDTGVETVDLSGSDTSAVMNMSNMFRCCYSLKTIEFGDIDTSSVTDMSHMFDSCVRIEPLNLSMIDTSNVTDMSYMFENCGNDESWQLNISGFDTSNVTNMSYMFDDCSGLRRLDVSRFDTSNVTDMSYMFAACSGIAEFDLSNFDTSNVTNMSGMFGGCNYYDDWDDIHVKIDVSGFDTSNVTDMSYMFSGSSVEYLNVSGFDTSKVTTMAGMFDGTFTELDVSNLDTSSVTDMSSMFGGCWDLKTLDISNFDTSNVTDMSYMFSSSVNLETIELGNFDTSKVTDMTGMFSECISLKSLDLSSFDTSNVLCMNRMFAVEENYEDESQLANLNLSSFNTEKVTDVDSMFKGCTNLSELNLSNFDLANVEDVEDEDDGENLIAGCSALKKIYTPRNFAIENALPKTNDYKTAWRDEHNRMYTSLPMNLDESLLLQLKTKEYIEITAEFVEELESAHNYADNTNICWTYTDDAAASLSLTFDEKTSLENNKDYVFIYTSNGKLVGQYTGTELAGKTIKVNGKTVKVILESDDSGNDWGFKVIEVEAEATTVQTIYAKSVSELESEHEYENNFDGWWIYTVEDATEEDVLTVTFDWDTYLAEGDYIYIYDGEDNEIGCFEGYDLGDNYVDVPGNTVKIRLVSDGEETGWGFKVKYLLLNQELISETIIADSVEDLESAHPYADDSSIYWIYTDEMATTLDVTFDENTCVEDDYDWIYIYDGNDNLIDSYTGNALAGQTVHVEGNTVKIKLESDESTGEWGFKVTEIITEKKEEKPSTPVEEVFNDVNEYDWFKDSVQYVYNKGMMSGSAGSFNPNGDMTRAMMVTTLYRMEGSPKVTDYTASSIFSDVEKGSWYEDAVNWAYNEGVTTGYPELKLFGSNDNVTREQLVVFLYRYADKQGLNVTERGDVTSLRNYDKTSDYATEGISWAVGTGLISGIQLEENGVKVYDLAPQGSATRAQLATILMRFCEYYNL